MNIIKKFVLSEMANNCYLLDCNGKIVLIDTPGNIERVTKFLDENNLKLDYVLITHAHFDHIIGADYLYQNGYIDTLYVPPKEITMFTDNSQDGNLGGKYGLDITFGGQIKSLTELPTHFDVEIQYISGHSIESAIFIFNEQKTIFSGDTLFKKSIGRSDFNYGNYEALKEGINKYIMVKDDYKVYPGHGFSTSTLLEKDNHLLG